MRNSLSFAVTLHRVFDSGPPKTKTLFYSGERQTFPIEKPNGLYVFMQNEWQKNEGSLTIACSGFMPVTVEITTEKITPVILYPDRSFSAPANWKLISGDSEPDKLIYLIDSRYELKLAEHNFGQGYARIRSRKGFTGGCLLFEAGEQREIALILEKQSPDIFYLNKLDRDYTVGSVRRVYCARADAEGKYYLVVPEDFIPETINYL